MPSLVNDYDKIDVIVKDTPAYFALKEELFKYEAIILHSLQPIFFELILNIPKTVNVVWIIFGTDFYHTFMSYRRTLLLPQTRKMDLFTWSNIKHFLKPYYRKLIGKESNFTYVKRCLEHINYCALSQEETYRQLMETGFTKVKFLNFNYFSVEETIGEELFDKSVNAENILIGNSACLYNNHFDAFELIKNINLENRKIIVPLSYGYAYVRKKVIKKGKKLFKDHFFPLIKFISRNEYNQILLSCSFVIMNHLRPQARGNIITALWLGAKVFLNEDTIFFKDFSKRGLSVFPISSIKSYGEKAFSKINNDQRKHNRNILMNEFGKKVIIEQCKQLVDTIKTPKSI
ncbi:MAG: TDP-N-acetylfucosamine:lipid II N-acetylfucosaminyltransferase [Calditrichaceae bacterium]|nr:TDP-N-acetylfucosamine:lipid II N-acetylfucosaminyltransferase [Calditrichaceae bacterium]